MNGAIHSFTEHLEWSQSLSDEASWVQFYKTVWPDMQIAARIDAHGQWQRWGVDRVVYLKDGRQITIDEKKRERDYGDVLLEAWSVWYAENNARNKVGWALDKGKLCDYIAYAIVPSQKCYLLPLDLLQRTFRRNGRAWRDKFGIRDAPNHGYLTRNIPVPWPDLSKALTRQMFEDWGDQEITLPPPRIDGDQFAFNWGEGAA